MDRQAAAVEVVRLVAQQIEKLRVHERRHKIESAVRIREDDEQRRFAVAQGIQLQLVLRHEVPQLRDVKGRKAGAAGNQNRLQSFARGHFEFAVLLHGEVVRVLLLQLGEQQVHWNSSSSSRASLALMRSSRVMKLRSSGSASYQMYPMRAE